MFKDYEKYLSKSIKVYLFVLAIIFILKIVGLDYFDIDISNSTFVTINNILLKYNFITIWYFITLTFYSYVMYSIIGNDRGKRTILASITASLINITITVLIKNKMSQLEILICDFSVYFVCGKICSKDSITKYTKRAIVVFIMNIIYQSISLILRNIKFSVVKADNVILGLIMNLDYLLLMYITYKVYFERRKELCGEAGLYSLKKLNLKSSLKESQRNLQNNFEKFKHKNKEEKLTLIIFFILSFTWNVLNVVLILIVAKINGTLIECIFILTSFWLSKGKFGKPFHFDSMSICFIVSNLSYFVLNRVTSPLGISIIIPVLLGVGLSYVTSKFVKKTYKPLYRGMPLDVFEDTITKVTEKDSVKYKICKEFYIDNESDLSLSFKYNYSVPGIRKIKERINEKIKGLN